MFKPIEVLILSGPLSRTFSLSNVCVISHFNGLSWTLTFYISDTILIVKFSPGNTMILRKCMKTVKKP